MIFAAPSILLPTVLNFSSTRVSRGAQKMMVFRIKGRQRRVKIIIQPQKRHTLPARDGVAAPAGVAAPGGKTRAVVEGDDPRIQPAGIALGNCRLTIKTFAAYPRIRPMAYHNAFG